MGFHSPLEFNFNGQRVQRFYFILLCIIQSIALHFVGVSASSINAIVNSLYPQLPWQIVTFICLELVFWITIGLLICSALNWRKKGDIWMRCALIGECVIIFGAFYQILITILMFHLQIVDIPLEINSTAQILLGPVVWEFIAIFIISLLGWRFILNKAPAFVNHPTFIQRYSQFFPIVLGCAIIFLSLFQKIGNLDFYYVNNSDTSLYLWGRNSRKFDLYVPRFWRYF